MLISCTLCVGIFSCVKNEPFMQSYMVPAVYNYNSKDSSVLARIIMMHGIENYLATSVSNQLNQAILDSLWNNKDSTFTQAMVPGYLYSHTILNRMITTKLPDATTNPDSMKILADSVVYLSQFNGRDAGNGVAGVLGSAAGKYLFDARGVEFKEVWVKAMLGAMCMADAMANLYVTPGEASAAAWDVSYRYTGLPENYDPSFDYTVAPLKADRPLAIAGLFAGAKAFRGGARVYEEFRRGKASVLAGDRRVSNPSADTLKIYIEKTIAGAAIDALDNAKQTTNLATKLHSLSQAYGLVRALNYGSQLSPLTPADYLTLRAIFKINFYTLALDNSYVKINEARNILSTAFTL